MIDLAGCWAEKHSQDCSDVYVMVRTYCGFGAKWSAPWPVSVWGLSQCGRLSESDCCTGCWEGLRCERAQPLTRYPGLEWSRWRLLAQPPCWSQCSSSAADVTPFGTPNMFIVQCIACAPGFGETIRSSAPAQEPLPEHEAAITPDKCQMIKNG